MKCFKEYEEDIDFLFEGLEEKVLTKEMLEFEKQTFKIWFENVLEEVYQAGLNEGIDRTF